MPIPFSDREEAVKELFDYEESNNIPADERLTYDPYADMPAVKEPSPRKKKYVDIRQVIGRLRDLKENKKIK